MNSNILAFKHVTYYVYCGKFMNKKLRVLCLHGMHQSAEIFNHNLASFRKATSSVLELVFLTAPHKMEGETEKYQWFSHTGGNIFTSSGYLGEEESFQFIEKAFQENGPFDGILGFSQGAFMTALLCGLAGDPNSAIRFNFAMIFSGFPSSVEKYKLYYSRIPSSLLTFHSWGTSDDLVPCHYSEELAKWFPNAVRYEHPGGHVVPSNAQAKSVYKEFIQKLFEKF